MGCWLLLVLVGILSIYSSVHSDESVTFFEHGSKCLKQLFWAGISLCVGVLILFLVKPLMWEALSLPAYIAVCALLVGVLIFGSTVNGSKSWFDLGPVGFQPSELSKITTALVLALVGRSQGFRVSHPRDFLLILAVILVPMLIIFAEGETGTLLVYFGFLFAFYREGLSGWWIFLILCIITLFVVTLKFPIWVAGIVLGVMVAVYYITVRLLEARDHHAQRVLRIIALCAFLFGAAVIFSTDFAFKKILKPYQRARIEVLLGIREDPMGVGYNVNQSMIAIGSGGFAGKGWLQGTQTAHGFVPEQSTDFIFCTIGEEAGFLGCLGVIALYFFLIAQILKDAESSREPFTRIYGYSIAGIISMHMMINIGMTIGIMPVIGIPLPLISYGGSSMLSFTIMLSIFLSLVRQERRYF